MNNLLVPVPSLGDGAYAAAKAVLSAIPILGGPAAELFQVLVQSPLDRRRQVWMDDVTSHLAALQAQGLKLEALNENEVFVSAVLRATQAALKTHQKEKLVALRNAILNIALGKGPEETLQSLLLGYVDDLTEMHLRILAALHRPVPAQGTRMGALSGVLELMIPPLRGQRMLYDQLWRDLNTRGLVNTENLHVTLSDNGLSQPRTSELGAALLHLISLPQ